MIGLVVMAYGTPASGSAADIEAYYTHIRRGRPPSPEQLADLVGRYEAIGGASPLRAVTEAQAAVLAGALGVGWRAALGYKHASPFVEDAVAELAATGVDRVVGVVLAPHDSRGSIGEYDERLRVAAAAHGLDATTLRSWADLPAWRERLAQHLRAGLAALPPDAEVLFTAHSLPERVLTDGDPYVEQLHESASAIAAGAGVDRWRVAWQSAARTPEPWRGPDVVEVIDGLDAEAVLVCPQGFTADHLEVLYDLDVVAARAAEEHGLTFARTPMLNDDPGVLTALAERLRHL